jgi:hypothetical protein
MVSLIRRFLGWTLKRGGRLAFNTALRRGGQSALSAVPQTTQKSHTQVFNVTPPVTVYVRASHCRITVSHHVEPKVILEANVYRAFGVELTAEQDEAGIYIVARRKAVVGRVTRTDFSLTVPADSHLALHLTPGDVVFRDVNGVVELPVERIFTARS